MIKKRIVFFGDSITQMGVDDGGYVRQLEQLLRAGGYDVELIGKGIGGNKVYDLYLRMEEDVLSLNPDMVLIYVGINDVWHKTSGTGTEIEKYEQFYRAIIRKMQAKGIAVVLCTPSVIGEKKHGANPQDADLDSYSRVIRKLASDYGCKLVDLRKAFTEYELAHNHGDTESGLLTTDRVHLNNNGNRLVAEQMKTVIQELLKR